jgi:cell filamentation protein
MSKIKYAVPGNEAESEILPNLLNLKTKQEIEQAELHGFLHAYKVLFDELKPETSFDLKYIFRLHKLALGHLYSFAGKLRTVNISKGGFMFPPAKYLDSTLKDFEKNILMNLPKTYTNKEDLIKDIAKVHAELLFIHPFREGNGRTSRLLANLMAGKAGYKLLDLENFSKRKFEEYVQAVKQAAGSEYTLMEKIISSLFHS